MSSGAPAPFSLDAVRCLWREIQRRKGVEVEGITQAPTPPSVPGAVGVRVEEAALEVFKSDEDDDLQVEPPRWVTAKRAKGVAWDCGHGDGVT